MNFYCDVAIYAKCADVDDFDGSVTNWIKLSFSLFTDNLESSQSKSMTTSELLHHTFHPPTSTQNTINTLDGHGKHHLISNRTLKTNESQQLKFPPNQTTRRLRVIARGHECVIWIVHLICYVRNCPYRNHRERNTRKSSAWGESHRPTSTETNSEFPVSLQIDRIAISYIRHLQNTLNTYPDESGHTSSTYYESSYPDQHSHIWQNHAPAQQTPTTRSSEPVPTANCYYLPWKH